jgi:hypothetical protein
MYCQEKDLIIMIRIIQNDEQINKKKRKKIKEK